MWELKTEWYEIVTRASAVFLFLFIVFRVWGKRHFGQLTSFDLILLLIMSEAVQNSLVDDEMGIPAAWISILTMVSWNIILNKLSYHSRLAEKIIQGNPEVLIENGKLNEKLMRKENISFQEIQEAIRLEGVEKINDVARATLEANGKISVIVKSQHL